MQPLGRANLTKSQILSFAEATAELLDTSLAIHLHPDNKQPEAMKRESLQRARELGLAALRILQARRDKDEATFQRECDAFVQVSQNPSIIVRRARRV